MNTKHLKHHSKFLSLVLRHRPEVLDLTLDSGGWVSTDLLLERMRAAGRSIDRELLTAIVEQNDKQRFALSADGSHIRANQGHSVGVELGYAPVVPPAELYHGTATKHLDSILRSGLERRNRHHVHLSADVTTATKVGQRHGKLVLLSVQAARMHEAGHLFYRSENGVWLTEAVPVAYLRKL